MSASPAPYTSAVITVSMPPPGRSSAVRRSSASGSPKCMKRPPLQVPMAVLVGSMRIRLEAGGGAGAQRRFQALERVCEQLLVELVAVPRERCALLVLHAGAQLLELGDADREILPVLG